MSTIATSKSPTSRTRSSASWRLLHLEAVGEQLPHPEPDEWVIVDHKAVWALAQDCFRSLVAGFDARREPAPLSNRS